MPRINSSTDTQFVKSIVSNWNRRGGELRFPHRPLFINETIELNDRISVNGRITCESPADEYYAYENPKNAGHLNQWGSAIIWDGPPNQPMFVISGANLIWDGPALWGTTRDSDSNRPSAAIEIRKSKSIGTGRVHFRQLHACGVQSAIETTHKDGDGNCDQLQVDRLCIWNVDYGYRSRSTQNIGSVFGYVIAHTVYDSVFRFENGLTTTSCYGLMVNNNVNRVLSFKGSGGQVGMFLLQGMKVDPKSSGSVLVHNDALCSFASVTFRNCVGFGSHTFELMGEVLLNIDSCQGIINADCVTGQARSDLQVQVVISNSRIGRDVLSAQHVVGFRKYFHCRMTNCASVINNSQL